MNFQKYVSFKIGQHARALRRARQFRGRGALHAYYLEQAAVVCGVLAADLHDDRALGGQS